MLVKIHVIENQIGRSESIVGGNGGCVDLRDARVEQTVAGAHHHRALATDGIRKTNSRRDVAISKGHLSDVCPEWICRQTGGGESLQVIAGTETEGEATGDANGVLHKGGIFVGIWVRDRGTEVLNVIARNLVSKSTKRRELQAVPS